MTFAPLVDGELLDNGYNEFLCTPRTSLELLNGGMTHVNGQPVRLQVVDRFPQLNAVLVRCMPLERAPAVLVYEEAA